MNFFRTWRRHLLLGVLAAALVALFLFAMIRVGPLAPIKVTLAPAAEGVLTPQLFGIGTVEARRSWLLGPTVAGRVLSVKVDVGDVVRAGQLLAEMDPVDIDQRLASLDAGVERAGSALNAAVAGQADARARRELAAANMRRNQDLAGNGFISAAALEGFGQALASADAALESARAAARAAEHDLNRARADRQAVLAQRSNVRLVAAADGIVSARDAEPGSTVVAGQSVLRVIDPASLWVKLRLDQGRSGGLRPGLKARVILRSRPGIELAATVARVELLADSVAEERVAQLAFDEPPQGLAVGEMAEATIALPALAKSMLVPAASVQRQGGSSGVWRLQSGKPVFVPVKVGAAGLDGQVQILDGLRAGEDIVIYSQKPLAAGMRVQVVEAIAEPRTAGGGSP